MVSWISLWWMSCTPPGSDTVPRKSLFNKIPNQSQFQCFLCPCTSFCTSSILVTSICTRSLLITSVCFLTSMCMLSCCTCLQFSAMTCMSHVLQCVHVRSAACCLAAVAASEAAHVQPDTVLSTCPCNEKSTHANGHDKN